MLHAKYLWNSRTSQSDIPRWGIRMDFLSSTRFASGGSSSSSIAVIFLGASFWRVLNLQCESQHFCTVVDGVCAAEHRLRPSETKLPFVMVLVDHALRDSVISTRVMARSQGTVLPCGVVDVLVRRVPAGISMNQDWGGVASAYRKRSRGASVEDELLRMPTVPGMGTVIGKMFSISAACA